MTALNSESLVIEGDSLVVTFTLDTAVSTTTSYNWKIVPKGLFPALSSDFTILTGVVSFVAGESEQTITIPTTTNTAPAVDRSFVLEITDSSDTLVASSDVITLDDNDELSASSINSFGGGESDVLGAATSFEIGTMSGLGGDDYYIITQYQQSDVSISDDAGTNVIKFDYGVEITGFSETSRFGGRQVARFTVTLESGAEISITSPKGTLSYQIGDGGILNYDAFKAAIGASGTNDGSALAGPFPVESSTPSPDLSGERPSINSFGGGESDVLGAATSFGIGSMSGLGGSDYYIITQYQQSDVSISDDAGMNVVKFDYGVEITGFSETSRFGGRQVARFTVTLESGAEISIASPKGTLSYQIGDGGVLDYDAFKAAIGASGTNDGSALANSFPVPFPAVIDNHGPVFISGDSASVAEDIVEDATIYTATAADADGDTVRYSITGGNDAGVFEIDASTGVVLLISGQSLDAEGTSSYTLTITANSQALGEAAKAETLDVDITVTDVNDEAPVITFGATGLSLAENVVVDTSTVIYTAAGTYDITPIVWSLKAGNSDDAALFSIDTSSGAVTFQSGTAPDFEVTSSYAFTVVATSGSLSAEQVVTIAITDVNDEAPVITSGATELSLAENVVVDTSTVIYTAAGTYDVTPIVWSLKSGNSDDAALFSIDTSSGAVTFQSGTTPDFEAKSSYAFTVVATSGSLSAEQIVTVAVTDVNDVAPVITSSASGDALDEGTQIAATQAIYTAAGTFDVTPIVWSLKAGNGDDAALFSIDTSSGAVTFQSGTTPDFEAKSSYDFTIVATSGSLSAEQAVTIAITDVNDGDAGFRIVSSGDIDDAVEGDVLTVSLATSDPDGDGTFTYQWQRDGSDITSATGTDYTVVYDDRGTSLTVMVSYTDGGGRPERVASDGVMIPASFRIISDADVNTPVVGDVLIVNRAVDDPDGNGNGLPTYQWFVVGGADIIGATFSAYTITEADQIIGVRVSYTDGAGNDEIVTTQLRVASVTPIIDPSAYEIVQDASPEDDNILSGTSADEIIQGGNKDDVIDTGRGNDVVIGGYGRDTITLSNIFGRADNSAITETIVYRFSSDGDWTALDGSDSINGFGRGIDKLLLVDVGSSPVDLATFLESDNDISVQPIFDGGLGLTLFGFRIIFPEAGFADGPGAGAVSGHRLSIYYNFQSSVELVTVFNDDGTVTYEGAKFLGEGGAKYDPDTGLLTDLSLLLNYFSGELRVIKQSQLGFAITNFDEDAATYVIDDADSGRTEHISDPASLGEGSILYARASRNDPDGRNDDDVPTYQWKRGGGNILGATSAAYVVTAADLGRGLTVTVSYTDGSGEDERVTSATVTIPAAPTSNDQSRFIITSDGDVDTPIVGDVLTVTRDTDDPDGNGDGTLTYQWFVVDGADIAGATTETYIIAEADQTIGVRVSYADGNAVDETITVQLNIASVPIPIVDPSAYVLVRAASPGNQNDLVGTSANELHQGGNRNDRITTGGGDDIVIGGYGNDRITLGEGVDTIVYRFSSISDVFWVGIDGGDSIGTRDGVSTYGNFERGVDKIVFVDVDDTPIDRATFIGGIRELDFDIIPGVVIPKDQVSIFWIQIITNGTELSGFTLSFRSPSFPDGPGSGGTNLFGNISIYYKDRVPLYGEGRSEGAKFVGDGFSAVPGGYLTDSSLLPNYFGEGFDDGLRVIKPSELGVAVTDFDEGDAVYVIDDADSGLAEHIADASGLAVGSTLYARLSSDDPDGNGTPSYQWKRGGGDIVGANAAAYVIIAADLGRALTVIVSYTDDGGTSEHITPDAIDILAAPVSANQASFSITSDGSVDTPLVGDELTVSLNTPDPDGNGDGTFSYQWFVVDGPDIVGATEASYTIAEAGQTIGVRVSYTDDDGTAETVTTELSVASAYNVIKIGDGNSADTLTGTSADDLILGGNNDDTITTGGGDDIVIGGYGRDMITLSDDGAETVVYRFASDVATDPDSNTGWTAIDGADRVTNFERGVDKLLFVDVDGTPIDLAGFLAGSSSINISPHFEDTDLDVLTGITFQFIGEGFLDGPGNGGTQSGRWFRLFYKEEDKVTVYNDDGTTTDEGAKFVGEDGALLDTSHIQSNRHYLTDLSLLPNYFGEDFDDGLRVIELGELGVDNAPVITSDTMGTVRDEGTQISDSTAVYTATGTFDLTPIVWSLRGDDASLFDINSTTGEVTFKVATTPDYETKSSYSFTVVAMSASREATQLVTFNINNVNDNSPSISQSGTQNTLNEGTFSSATDTGYSYTATDADGGSTVLTVSGDSRFEIVSGDLRIKAGSVFDYETSSDRSITLTINAADSGIGSGAASNAGTRQVTITIGNVNDNNPVITSGGTATMLAENTEVEITTAVYTATGTFDLIPVVWSLKAGTGDIILFGIDSSTGEVTFQSATTPDYETKSSYSFTVVATSGSLSSEQAVTITIGNVDDNNPVITSGGTATALVENTEVETSTAVYIATGTFDLTPIVWSLRGDDAGLFDINSNNGQVTFKVATTPDYETKSSYSFTVVATSGSLPPVEKSVTIAVTDVADEGDATFTITSDGSVDTPLVGDELTVTLDTPDPDGNGDGTFSYQWFVVDGPDIEGATEASYTITEVGQTIGVRVSYTDGEGFNEEVEVELNVASVDPIVDRSAYTLVKIGDGSSEDTLAGTSADDLIQGGDQDDTITTGGGGDIIIGGYGRDMITLSDDGAETVVYRFSSDTVTVLGETGWIAIDGADRISNFERGVDKLVLVDVDGTPIDRAEFLAGGGSAFRLATIVESSDRDVITGVTFQFAGFGRDNGPDGNGDAGRWLSIFFKDAVTVYEDYSTDMTTTAEGTRLLGLNGEHHDTTDSRSDRWLLTDFSLIPNYFQTADADFTDGLQVIEASELGVDII